MKLIRTYFLTILSWLAVSTSLLAQSEESGTTSFLSFPKEFILEYTFTGIAVVLLFIIFLLSRFYTKLLSEKGQQLIKRASKGSAATVALISFMVLPELTYAAQEGITAHMTNTTFFVIALVILIELGVIVFLVRNITSVLGLDEATAEEESGPSAVDNLALSMSTLWAKMNAFKSKEKEKDLVKDHEYDGIRELDNDLPPWWVWGFYITIIFSVIYLWRYHVAQTAPLQHEELEIAIAKAEEQMRTYRASAASLVDEETVTVVEDESFIEKGRLVYMSNCVACHGTLGEGGVGPNLTDEYWIHGGDVKSIFKVVKYGVVEKGMTPWKDLLSPSQIAQVSNYVLTLEGTNPPNGKEPQGEKFDRSAFEDAADEEADDTETEI